MNELYNLVYTLGTLILIVLVSKWLIPKCNELRKRFWVMESVCESITEPEGLSEQVRILRAEMKAVLVKNPDIKVVVDQSTKEFNQHLSGNAQGNQGQEGGVAANQ